MTVDRRAAIGFVAFFAFHAIVGCVHQIPRPPGLKTEVPVADSTLATASLNTGPRENPVLYITAKDFRDDLKQWSRKNPRASYTQLARQVKRFIDIDGIIYFAEVHALPEKEGRFRILKLGDGREFLISKEGGFDSGCKESFAPISVLRFEKGKPVVLTSAGEMAVDGLDLERTTLRKSEGDSPSAVIFRPNGDAPWNVASGGHAIVWKYDLKMSLLEEWWKKLQRRYRELREELPFVALEIDDTGFRVETSQKSLLPAAYENMATDKEAPAKVVRRVYKQNHVVVDFQPTCS